MEIKFDIVRIGKKRKNPKSEVRLIQNVDLLKNNLRTLLLDKRCSHKNNLEHITLIIPAKDEKITYRLADFKDGDIRALVKKHFSAYVYLGKDDTILDNSNNRVFR